MKKLCATILAVLIAVSAVLGTASAVQVDAESEKVSLNELADCYRQCLQTENSRFTFASARSYLLNGLDRGWFRISAKRFSSGIYARSKKIMDFYQSANEDDFTKLYHPNADLSINEEEILNDLPDDNSLCIMLFGNQMEDDGTMSAKFLARCKTALAMAKKYPNAWIMVTGGHTAGYQYPSEAAAGKAWLIEHGVDESRIITDELAWDTFSNVLCSFATSELTTHKEIRNFVVVSSDYHVPKCSIFLMTYIYAFGYDLPVEQGGRGYQYLGNLGAVLDAQ